MFVETLIAAFVVVFVCSVVFNTWVYFREPLLDWWYSFTYEVEQKWEKLKKRFKK